MRRAAAPARRPPLGARRPATRKPKPGADAPGLAGREEWPSHSTRDLAFTLPSGARYHAIRKRGMDQAQHDERGTARAKPRAQRDRTRLSERATEPGFEVIAVAARQLERGAVVQDHHVLPAEEGLELLDLLEVHDGRPVDPDEAGCVELTLEVLHRLAQQVPGLADVDAHVVPLRVDPFDLAHGQERHLAARLDEQTIEVRRVSGPRRLSVAQEGRQLLGQLPQTAVTHLQLGTLQ